MDLRYLYLGRSSKGRVKIGIARNVRQRWADIDRSTPGSRERPTFAVKIFYARRVEQFLHRLFWLWRVRHTGSGKTEWFQFPLGVDLVAVTLAVLIMILCRVLTVAGVLLALMGVGVLVYLVLESQI